MIIRILGLLFAALSISAAYAEEVSIPLNTLVPFAFTENQDSKSIQEGDQLPVEVTQDVKVVGADQQPHVVFKKGQVGYAEIFYATPPTHFGVSGRISIHYIYIPDTSGQEHKLRCDIKRSPMRNPLLTVVPLPAVPVAWAIKGKNVSVFDDKHHPNQFQAKVIESFTLDTTPYHPSVVKAASPTVVMLATSPITDPNRLATFISRKIRQKWHPPILRGNYKGVIRYRINRQGHPEQIEISQSSGNEKWDQSMQKALETAAPFPEAIPYMEQTDQEDIELLQNFEYSR